MIEVFGLVPLIKIIVIAFTINFTAIFIGKNISNRNEGIQYIIGLTLLVSVIAIIITQGASIYMPTLASILILFRIKIIQLSQQIIESFKLSGKISGLFLIFFIIELFKIGYFSKEEINIGYGDYSYYLTTIEGIIKSGIESPMAYLSSYDLEFNIGIYHYFDLYLLAPGIFADIPPLLVYLLFYIPFSLSFATFLIINLFNKEFNVQNSLISIIAISYVGINLFDLTTTANQNYIFFPKAIYLLVPLIFIKEWKKNQNTDYLIIAVAISLSFNPIIFLVSLGSVIVILSFEVYKNNFRILNLFSKKHIIIYCFFLAYFLYPIFLSRGESNEYLSLNTNEINISNYLSNSIYRFTSYLSILKYAPIVLIVLCILIYQFAKNKKVQYSLILLILFFIIGHSINSFLYFHSESSQFFSITVISLFACFTFYAIIQLFNKSNTMKLISIISLTLMLLAHKSSNFAAFKYNESTNRVISKNYFTKINSSLQANSKGVYFESETKEWRKKISHLPFEIGHFKLIQNINIIQGTTSSLFIKDSSFIQNETFQKATFNGPFNRYCNSNNYFPSTIYDEDYFKAIDGFIKQYNINFLVFSKEVTIPKWLSKLKVKKVIKPTKEIDPNIIYILNE